LEVGNCEPKKSCEPQACYICKSKYSAIHHFYDQLCPECAELNYAKRTELADLRGRVALVTGGRVKIGYQAGLKLLRAGAQLIVTTRFPRDSASRYSREHDFEEWKDRLEIVGLDLRHTPSVEAFCRHLVATRERLDFIINNACQTVRRPPEFYAHMMEGERAHSNHESLLTNPESRIPNPGCAAQLSQLALLPEDLPARKDLFPEGMLDNDLQQVDLRGRNSWRLLLDEVSSVELLEVQLVNAVAPFIINARLKALMLRTPERDKHIVNVSAVEGQFYRKFKTTRHPHTNMAKAALNMMTRTSATDYHADGIHMNSVDTGWVTDEDAAAIAARKTEEQGFHPPLDIVDGAARIVDPIVSGINTGQHLWGQFLKDYRPTDW
jgi:NAD(P)-dependent dehydrogenase (short-subunit alcohol dehydrogenase family)